MSSFHRTSSPILTMTSQSAHQLPFDRPFAMQQSSPFGNPSVWSRNVGQTMVSAPPRGRKRSRDEASVNLDSPEKAPPPIEPVQEDVDEWEYGPGMVLIKKGSGYVHEAGNQSGTWLEERAVALEALRKEEALKEQQRQSQERPSLRSHKSSRLDLSAHNASQEGTRSSSDGTSPKRDLSGPSPETPDGGSAGGSAGGSQPIIDDFTFHLGIGWNRLSEDEHIQAAARGWARYIESRYPVTDPKILLESKGLDSYLVEAREGYFLFAENLRQGRLVSSDPQRALANLKTTPPVFDGETTMAAADTPRPAETPSAASPAVAPAPAVAAPSGALSHIPHPPADVDVDMI